MRIPSTMMIGIMIAALCAILTPTASATAMACSERIKVPHPITWHGQEDQNPVGAVQVRADNCGNYWAYVRIYHTLNSNEFAQGWISRWENGNRSAILSCDQGNGRIIAGQTWCVTGKLRAASSASVFVGSAHYYYRTAPTWTWQDHYWGMTPSVP